MFASFRLDGELRGLWSLRIWECGLQESEYVACFCHKILHSATFSFGTLEASSLIFWKLANPLDAPASKTQGVAALKTVLWTPSHGALEYLTALSGRLFRAQAFRIQGSLGLWFRVSLRIAVAPLFSRFVGGVQSQSTWGCKTSGTPRQRLNLGGRLYRSLLITTNPEQSLKCSFSRRILLVHYAYRT